MSVTVFQQAYLLNNEPLGLNELNKTKLKRSGSTYVFSTCESSTFLRVQAWTPCRQGRYIHLGPGNGPAGSWASSNYIQSSSWTL